MALLTYTGRSCPCPLSTSGARRPLGCTQTRCEPSGFLGGSKPARFSQRAISRYLYPVALPRRTFRISAQSVGESAIPVLLARLRKRRPDVERDFRKGLIIDAQLENVCAV